MPPHEDARTGGPLAGRCIVITRPQAQALAWLQALRALGAEPLLCAAIAIVPPEDWQPVDTALRRLQTFDWVVFTSGNGVRFFCQRWQERGGILHDWQGVRVAAVGPQTALALQRYGIQVDVIPDHYRAESLAASLTAYTLAGKQLLLPGAATGRDEVTRVLSAMGAEVTQVTVYRTAPSATDSAVLRRRLQHHSIDMITFTSASAVTALQTLLGPDAWSGLLAEVAIACIGPVTAAAVQAAGLQVDVLPEAATIPALTTAIVAYFATQPPVQA